MAISGVALGELTVGGLVLWSGITNKPVADVFKTLASGKLVSVPASTPTGGTDNESGDAEQELTDTTPGGGTNAENQTLGRLMASGYGWGTGENWTALNYGWGTLESGWSNTAINGTWPDCAYGIPQANPGNKMPKAAWPTYAGGTSSATSQIAWGLNYIQQTYGSPENVPGWLGQGGYEGY
jgi:hypothetical protein